MNLIQKDIYEQTYQRVHVGIPAIPKELHTELIKMASIPEGESFLAWQVTVGDKVKKGDILAKYNVKAISFQGRMIRATIKAPCNGRIAKINSIEHAIWDWQTEGETVSEGVYKTKNRRFVDERQKIDDSKIQFYIQPEVAIFDREDHVIDAEVYFTCRALENISEYSYIANSFTGVGRMLNGIKGFKTIGDRYWRVFSDDVIARVDEV